MKKEVDHLIDLFWMLWEEHTNTLGNIAPRDAIYLFALASKMSAYDSSGGDKAYLEAVKERPYKIPNESSFTGIRPTHLERAFRKLFTDRSTKT
jgi:hypothetical protein